MQKIALLPAQSANRLIFSLCFALSLICGPGQMPCLAEGNLLQATRLYDSGDYDQAVPLLEAEFKANPRDASAHYLMGNILLKKQSYDQAIKHFQRASQLDPQGPAGTYSQRELAKLSDLLQRPISSTGLPVTAVQQSREALQRSLQNTTDQTREAGEALDAECGRKLEEIRIESAQRLQSLNEQMKDDIHSNSGRGRGHIPGDVVSDWVHQEYDPRIQNEKDDCEKRLQEVRATYRAKLEAVEDAAGGINNGYGSKRKGAGSSITPLGTDLHVRNYEKDK